MNNNEKKSLNEETVLTNEYDMNKNEISLQSNILHPEKLYVKKTISNKGVNNNGRKTHSSNSRNHLAVNSYSTRTTVINNSLLLKQRLSIISEENIEEGRISNLQVTESLFETMDKPRSKENIEKQLNSQEKEEEIHTFRENFEKQITAPESGINSNPDILQFDGGNTKNDNYISIEKSKENNIAKDILFKEKDEKSFEQSIYYCNENPFNKKIVNYKKSANIHYDFRLNKSEILQNHMNDLNMSTNDLDIEDSISKNRGFFKEQIKREFNNPKKRKNIDSSKICMETRRILDLESYNYY